MLMVFLLTKKAAELAGAVYDGAGVATRDGTDYWILTATGFVALCRRAGGFDD
jgi:hypothetical protein